MHSFYTHGFTTHVDAFLRVSLVFCGYFLAAIRHGLHSAHHNSPLAALGRHAHISLAELPAELVVTEVHVGVHKRRSFVLGEMMNAQPVATTSTSMVCVGGESQFCQQRRVRVWRAEGVAPWRLHGRDSVR